MNVLNIIVVFRFLLIFLVLVIAMIRRNIAVWIANHLHQKRNGDIFVY